MQHVQRGKWTYRLLVVLYLSDLFEESSLLIDDKDWVLKAECRGDNNPAYYEDLRVHLPNGSSWTDKAKKNCVVCVVSEECLNYALSLPEDPGGIYGGTTGRERKKIRGELRARRKYNTQ